ncbi:hypothetical protein D3C79_890800 [compost metagenome]
MGLTAKGAQVLIDIKWRAVATFVSYKVHGFDRRGAGFASASVPPLNGKGRQAMRPLLFDHIGNAVFALATGNPTTAITQGRHRGGLQVTFQARNLSEGRWWN